MNIFHRILFRVQALFRKQILDAEMDEEMRSHIEMRTQENVEAGMSPEEARYAALRRFGGVESIKETCREQRGIRWLETWVQDIRFGARQLRKNPGFTTVAVLTLALGIGANSVVFSVVKGVLFRPLGFEEAEKLVWVRLANRATGIFEQRLSRTDFVDLVAESKSFDSLAAFNAISPIWDRGERAEHLAALSVTPSLADVLRIRPVLGRLFIPSDLEPSAERVVLISHELWQAQFGGSAEVLGQTMRLREHVYTIVGILPAGLEFPLGRAPASGNGSVVKTGIQDVWLPLSVDPGTGRERGERMFPVIGRLKQGVSMDEAQAELAGLAKRWEELYPDTNRGLNFEPLGFREHVLGRTRPGLHVLAVAVGAVLLICCVNLANLLLARGVARQRELAVRLALGAGRVRIISTLMMESLLLSLLGGGLGLALAAGAVHAIRTLSPPDVPFLREVNVDAPVVAFNTALSLVTVLFFGFFPALYQSRTEAAITLRSGIRISAGSNIRTWQRALLTGQIAVVLVLVTSAGLLLESFRRLMNLDLGYKATSVITINLNAWNLPTNEDNARLYQEMHAQIAALPGVEAAGVISSLPLTGKWTFNEKAQVFGRSLPEVERSSLAATFIAFDYFQAMGIPLVVGRHFRTEEMGSDLPVIIINESAAAALFPGETASAVIGKRFAVGSNPNRCYQVIGVVKDTRDVRLEERPQPRLYWHWPSGGAEFVVRTVLPARVTIPMLRDVVKGFGPRVILHDIRPMADIVSGTVAERRFLMVMLAVYAVMALGIATVGIFGVVAYQVAQRTNEFGIRLVLGASSAGVLRLVLAQAVHITLLGLAIGLLLSLGSTRLLSSQLFDLSPNDPLLFGIVSLLVFCVALCASFLPAWRASKTEPNVALRYE